MSAFIVRNSSRKRWRVDIISGTASVLYSNGLCTTTQMCHVCIAELLINSNMSSVFWINSNLVGERCTATQVYDALPAGSERLVTL